MLDEKLTENPRFYVRISKEIADEIIRRYPTESGSRLSHNAVNQLLAFGLAYTDGLKDGKDGRQKSGPDKLYMMKMNKLYK